MATAAGPGQPVTGPAVAAEQVPLRRNRDFNLLWGGQAVSLLGTQMSVIAYPLLILTVTGSAAQAGIVSGATLIGTVALLLPAGVVADRYPRKRILMITSLAQMIAVATVVPAGLTHRVYLAHLAAVGLTQGVASAFYIGASRGAVRRIVPAIQLPHALSRLFARDQAAALLGPPIGGALFGVAQFLPFACDSASFGAVATAAAMLRGPLDPAAEAADGSNAVPRVPIRRAVTNGMRYLIGQPFLRTVAIWSAAVNAVAAAMLLMVIVLARSRGATPLVIGGMFSVNAACGLAGALTAPRLINLVGGRRMALTTSWLLPACAVGIAFAPWVWLIASLGAVTTFTVMPVNVSFQARATQITPDEMQGQVGNAQQLFGTSLMWLAPPSAGALTDVIGPAGAIMAAAGLYAITAVWLQFNAGLRQLDDRRA